MKKIGVFIGATIGGYFGWWVAEGIGFMTAFIVSTIFSGAGMYFGAYVAREYLE